MNCPHCHGKNIQKNGHTHYGKQNYICNDCKHQFVEGGQDRFVSESDKIQINRVFHLGTECFCTCQYLNGKF